MGPRPARPLIRTTRPSEPPRLRFRAVRQAAAPAWCRRPDKRAPAPGRCRRSEEHTSELQSLMRSSYAVFCLKKKKTDIEGHQTNYKIPKPTDRNTPLII